MLNFSLFELLNNLTSPVSQYPSTILFLGKKRKEAAMREVFPMNNFRQARGINTINFRLDVTSSSQKYPICFANGDVEYSPLKIIKALCFEDKSAPLDWHPGLGTLSLQDIHYRLAFLFSDVICIFADDYGGLDRVADLLNAWAIIGHISPWSKIIRPRIIVAVSGNDANTASGDYEKREFFHGLKDQNTELQVYSSIELVELSGEDLSPLARYRRLREVLFNEIDCHREVKIQHQMLFSAIHLHSFFSMTLHHMTNYPSTPLNFIDASRSRNPVSDYYSFHLCNFIALARDAGCLPDTTCGFIASSMLMDAYPPGMHCTCLINRPSSDH